MSILETDLDNQNYRKSGKLSLLVILIMNLIMNLLINQVILQSH